MKEERTPEQEWTGGDPQEAAKAAVSPAAPGKGHKKLSKRGDSLTTGETGTGGTPPGGPGNGAQAPAGRHKNSVIVYIAVLFAVAFLLLLLANFMQQRNTAQLLEGLRDSNSAMENIELLQQRNIELDRQVDNLTAQIRTYEDQLKEAEGQKAALAKTQKENQALDLFWQLVKSYESGARNTCRKLIAQMEEAGLAEALPSQGTESAAAEFAAIKKAVTN